MRKNKIHCGKKMIKRIAAFCMVACLFVGSVSAMETCASEQVMTETDANVDMLGVSTYEEVKTRIDELKKDFVGTYFNSGRDTTCGVIPGSHANSGEVSVCDTRSVVQSAWFIEKFGTVAASQFPYTYTETGFIYGSASQCAGFAAFAEWYIFRNSNTESVVTSKIGTISFDQANVNANLQIGDLIRFDNAHSAIYVSSDDTGITVLDSNWASDYHCKVQLHTISYGYYSKITISRVNTLTPGVPDDIDEDIEVPLDSVPMYRLYNPNSGEHFYTSNKEERDTIILAGWNYEGVAWFAPTSGDPVYRLYNENAGDHHYTVSEAERDNLIACGWKYEGIAWRSGGDVPLYRAYNKNAIAGSHHYTKSKEEIDGLVAVGWSAEGIAWYGME